ncbi:hypothetical protein [Silvibacterium sp.]|uniref:hypothetical protein n=1 Tax=Silvibacterium sp. TaxID=1964179 RepID=UPI0039E6711E
MLIFVGRALAAASCLLAASFASAQVSQPVLTAMNANPEVYSSSRTGLDFAMASPAASAAITRSTPAPAATLTAGPLARLGVGSYVSPLGIGAGVAYEITRSFNVRVGTNFFSYDFTGTDTGTQYDAHLHLRSYQATADWFPFRGKSFHISGGLLFDNQNHATGTGGVGAGQSFTLNDTTYYGSYSDPVVGSGAVTFNKTAPMVTFGWGNWVSRRERRHITFPFEAGFAYTGTGKVDLNLTGSVCEDAQGKNCSTIANDPSVQANIQGQIQKLDKDLEIIRFYPIISSGVALRF